MDDRRVGLVIRALRRRRGWRQADLAIAAGLSQASVSRAERGHVSGLSLAATRRLAGALDARLELDLRWRGGELDRLLDELHARLGALVAAELERAGWRIHPEVTFMRYGERGSIDLLAARMDLRAVAVIELKSELTSYEEMQRRLDVKTRVATAVAEERLGWRPRHLAVLLVLADTRTNRDRVRRVELLLRASLPAATVEVRRWLRSPSSDLRGLWFVRDMRPRASSRRSGGPHRVRVRLDRPG